MLRRLPRRLLFLALGGLILLVASELGLRLVSALSPRVAYLLSVPWDRVKSDDPVLGHRPSPFYPGHDDWGFRNATVPESCEVLTIGDSMTYGYSAQEGESWPARIQSELDLELYNMSFGAYGPCEYLPLLREGLSLKPKVVLLAVFMGNDVSDAYGTVYLEDREQQLRTGDPKVLAEMERADREGLLPDLADRYLYPEIAWPRPEEPFSLRAWVSENLALWGLVRQLRFALDDGGYKSPFREDSQARDAFEIASQRPERYVYRGTAMDRTTFLPPRALLLQLDRDDPRIAEGYRVLERALREIHTLVQDAGAKLGVMVIPTKHRVYRDRIRTQGGEGSELLLRVVASEEHWTGELQGFLTERGIPFVNPTAGLVESLDAQHKPYQDSEDGHPNGVGYAVFAERITPLVRELLGR